MHDLIPSLPSGRSEESDEGQDKILKVPGQFCSNLLEFQWVPSFWPSSVLFQFGDFWPDLMLKD